MSWLRLFGQVFRVFEWKDYSVSGSRSGGNVKTGIIDIQGLWEARKTVVSSSAPSIDRHFHGRPSARYAASISGERWKYTWSGMISCRNRSENGVRSSAVRKEAKIPKGVVLYSARHSFAADMLDRTGTIVLVGKMMEHSSVTTTQRYLHPSMKGLAELVNERNAMRAQKGVQ